MKTSSLIIIAILGILVCTTSGCLKCACCGPYIGTVMFVRGTDTIGREYIQMNYHILSDSLNYYTNLGYTYTTFGGPYYYDVLQTCGPIKISQQQQMGNECITGHIQDFHCF